MNLRDLELIRTDAMHALTIGASFAEGFYATLFEIDPTVRSLFSDDLTAQRQKFADELEMLVTLATNLATDDTSAFETRANALGERHVGYHVSPGMYASVAEALLQALEQNIADWDDEHRSAWARLIRIVSASMLDDTPNL